MIALHSSCVINPIKPHKNASQIAIDNLYEVRNTFGSISSLCHIYSFSLYVVTTSNICIYLSTHPSIEQSVIINDLWRFDHTTNPKLYQNISLSWWDEAFNQQYKDILLHTKMKNFNISSGFSLKRSIKDIFIFYSFSTKEKSSIAKDFYINNLNLFFAIGDSYYNAIFHIFNKNYPNIEIPNNIDGNHYNPIDEKSFKASHLHLVVNNSRG